MKGKTIALRVLISRFLYSLKKIFFTFKKIGEEYLKDFNDFYQHHCKEYSYFIRFF